MKMTLAQTVRPHHRHKTHKMVLESLESSNITFMFSDLTGMSRQKEQSE